MSPLSITRYNQPLKEKNWVSTHFQQFHYWAYSPRATTTPPLIQKDICIYTVMAVCLNFYATGEYHAIEVSEVSKKTDMISFICEIK